MRVLIVDDEPLIMQYITRCVQQADAAVEIAGSVTSGAKALRLMETEHVDIVFADITMPKMDGIELLQKLKKDYPNTKVIMLTCHADFAYVRAAMQHHAEDYILKDEISPERVQTVLQKIQDAEEKKAAEDVEKTLQQRNYIRKLIEDETFASRIDRNELRSNGIYLQDRAFVVLTFWNDEENMRVLQKAGKELLENMLFYAHNENSMFLFANLKKNFVSGMPKERRAMLHSVEDNIHGLVGCSRLHHHITLLPEAIFEAMENQEQRFYGTKQRKFGREEGIIQLEQCIMRVTVQIVDKNCEAICRELENLVNNAKETKPQVIFLKFSLIQLMNGVQNKLGVDFGDVEARLRDSMYIDDVQGCVQTCIDILKQQGKQYSDSIRRAVEYIHAHYMEDISLHIVAEMAYLHKDYLSRQFKKEVGVNYSEYLLKVRLDQAKKLLETTDMRISDIASSVGISNLSYFSTVFHKTYGLKPKEVRKKNLDE
ncbi:MAG: response regulator [Eubacteriales bacterium]|nr:response regulator [Eubacteriales bacterium]